MEVFVFIVSRSSNPTRMRVLWKVSRDDAMKLCSDPRTAGRNYMLCWTESPGVQGNDWRYVWDNGKHDQVLSDLGITVLESRS